MVYLQMNYISFENKENSVFKRPIQKGLLTVEFRGKSASCTQEKIITWIICHGHKRTLHDLETTSHGRETRFDQQATSHGLKKISHCQDTLSHDDKSWPRDDKSWPQDDKL